MTTPRTACIALQVAFLTMTYGCSELIQAVGQPSSSEGSDETELTAPPTDDQALTRRQADALRGPLVEEFRTKLKAAGYDDLPPASAKVEEARVAAIELEGASMPFVLLQKGEKPANGWPLWICLHGGGGNDQAPGPHAWDVNTREWDAQKRLFQRVYRGAGLYFIPRMADDRRGRWWFAHNQQAFFDVIRKAILFRDVDPDRVYLMGISEGGYGAIRFAGNRPDRFAACGGMAAAEPLSTSPPENMRNVALRIDIGEKDTMFDRIGLARRMGQRLDELQAADRSGYDHALHVQGGRGHGIDYSLTPAWLATKVRNPRPTRIVWRVEPFDGQVELRNYWLALKEPPKAVPLHLDVRLEGQTLRIDANLEAAAGAGGDAAETRGGVLVVRLDDAMCDLDQPIQTVYNGAPRGIVRPKRTFATMRKTMAERWDPSGCFCAEFAIDLGLVPQRRP